MLENCYNSPVRLLQQPRRKFTGLLRKGADNHSTVLCLQKLSKGAAFWQKKKILFSVLHSLSRTFAGKIIKELKFSEVMYILITFQRKKSFCPFRA